MVIASNFGEVVGFGVDQLHHPGQAPLVVHRPPAEQQFTQQFGNRSLIGRHLRFRRAQGRDDALLDHRLEQGFLVLVVEIKRALGNPGAGSDVFQARGSEAFFYEELERGGKQFRGAGFLAAFAGGGCG